MTMKWTLPLLPAAALLAAACGGPIEEAAPRVTTPTAATKSGICTGCRVSQVVGYGQMGYMDGCDTCAHCEGNLVPHNVDSYNNYVRAPDGWFSCWYNSPDAICHSAPQILGYINVRRDWTRPDGTVETYGCTLGW